MPDDYGRIPNSKLNVNENSTFTNTHRTKIRDRKNGLVGNALTIVKCEC
jgi:hypothetical protein